MLCLRGAGRGVVLHPVGLLRYGSPSAFSVQCRTIPSILKLSFSEGTSKCNVETAGKERERNSRPCRDSVTYKGEKKKLEKERS